MLLIVEHGRREGERAAHAHVGKRDQDRAVGVLRLDVADDSPTSPRYETSETVSMDLMATGFCCRARCSIRSGIKATSNGTAASRMSMSSRVFSGLSSIGVTRLILSVMIRSLLRRSIGGRTNRRSCVKRLRIWSGLWLLPTRLWLLRCYAPGCYGGYAPAYYGYGYGYGRPYYGYRRAYYRGYRPAYYRAYYGPRFYGGWGGW
jgi:hypothetical protein